MVGLVPITRQTFWSEYQEKFAIFLFELAWETDSLGLHFYDNGPVLGNGYNGLMIILQAKQDWTFFAGELLFDNINLQVDESDRIPVGKNGAGKSTLPGILVGEEEPTSGQINKTRLIPPLRTVAWVGEYYLRRCCWSLIVQAAREVLMAGGAANGRIKSDGKGRSWPSMT